MINFLESAHLRRRRLELFENEKIWRGGVRNKRRYQTSVVPGRCLRLAATLASTLITHLSVQLNCLQLRCIVGNAGTSFVKEFKGRGVCFCGRDFKNIFFTLSILSQLTVLSENSFKEEKVFLF